MTLIGKMLLYIAIALLLAIVACYFLVQTRWGATQVGKWVSSNTDYHLAFDAADHRFSSPSHLLLTNVKFGRKDQPATLEAKRVDIGFSSRSAARGHYFASGWNAQPLPRHRAAAAQGRPTAAERYGLQQPGYRLGS